MDLEIRVPFPVIQALVVLYRLKTQKGFGRFPCLFHCMNTAIVPKHLHQYPWWLSVRVAGCGSGGPGSIPGRIKLVFCRSVLILPVENTKHSWICHFFRFPDVSETVFVLIVGSRVRKSTMVSTLATYNDQYAYTH